ncbi:MAG: hypothetical protein H0V17_03865 [Deltaproteobacteria bacterium]|nr:hypothetical protein [Deltaproteobacteria bacterium]MDQ3298272.1 hypothetical protein [Myxococcota bacterium]
MARAWLVLIACACGSKKDECPAAKQATIDAIDQALRDVAGEREKVKKELGESDPATIDTLREKLETATKLVESTLDCKYLGKASAPDLVPVQQTLHGLGDAARELPPAIAKAVAPVTELFEANLGLLSGPDPKIAAWCGMTRDAVAKMNTEIAPLWDPAKEEIATRREPIELRSRDLKAQDSGLRGWRTAVTETKPVGLPAKSLVSDRLYDALVVYQSACH